MGGPRWIWRRSSTDHLKHATAVFFCFDPLQDPRVRSELQGKTNDPQVTEDAVTSRQETVFHEMVVRFRRLHGLGHSEKTNCPLMVIVTKCDSWLPLLPKLKLSRPVKTRQDGWSALDLAKIRAVSDAVGGLLSRVSPELVAAAESFSRDVWFLPISATGSPPEVDSKSGVTGSRVGNPFPCCQS